jgi:hypothetical protein
MSLKYERVVKEDLNLGYGTTSVTMPAGGTTTGTKIGLHTFSGQVNVTDFGAKGDGVTDDYAAIVAAKAAMPSNGTIVFPPGTYAYNTSLNLLGTNLKLYGPGAILYFRGSGVAVNMVGTSATYGAGMEGLTIRGTSNCTKGLVVDYVRHGRFVDVSVQDVATTGIELLHAVDNVFENPRVSASERAFLVTPVTGLSLGSVSAGTLANGNTIINPMMDGVSSVGIALWAGSANTILGGHATGAGTGVLVYAGTQNTLQGIQGSGNSSYDFSIYATHTTLTACYGASQTAASLLLQVGARQTTVIDCAFYSIDLMAGTYSTSLINTSYAYGGAGTFINNGTNTLILNGYNATTSLPQDTTIPGPWVIGDSGGYVAFYGGTPIQQQTLATGAGKTVDNVITALQAIGLVKQS